MACLAFSYISKFPAFSILISQTMCYFLVNKETKDWRSSKDYFLKLSQVTGLPKCLSCKKLVKVYRYVFFVQGSDPT